MMQKTLVSMMPRLSQPERDRAIGMLQAGRDRRAVARLLGVHHSTVVRLEQRYNTTAAQDRANRLSQITGLKCQGHNYVGFKHIHLISQNSGKNF